MSSSLLLKIDQAVFPTAQENMDYDLNLMAQCNAMSNPRIFRAYVWPKTSITLPGRQVAPIELACIDTGFRPTGGGIVFHSPGDIVISLTTMLADDAFPKALKEKISFITEKIALALDVVGISTSMQSSQSSEENLAFCKTYFSPNELYHNGHKICGLTFKRYKDKGLLQGVIHLEAGIDHFNNILGLDIKQYLTNQPLNIDKQILIDVLINEFKQIV